MRRPIAACRLFIDGKRNVQASLDCDAQSSTRLHARPHSTMTIARFLVTEPLTTAELQCSFIH